MKMMVMHNWVIIGIILLLIGVVSPSGTDAKMLIAGVETNTICVSIIPMNNGTLSGYITDTAMHPIEGATVQVFFHNTSCENYSDATGYYHVTEIPICNCTKNATCSKEGYYTEWVSLTIWENTSYNFTLTAKARWLYVGGSGLGNYTKIQDAINASSDGDTVFVYDDSSPYFENVCINKSISVIGEHTETTLVNGDGYNDTFCIVTEGTLLHNFTISNNQTGVNNAGIRIRTNHTSISKNIVINNKYGIIAYYNTQYSFENTLENNIFNDNYVGIYLGNSSYNKIVNNSIINNYAGIILDLFSMNNIISQNTITCNDYAGILIGHSSSHNKIRENTLNNNSCSILLTADSHNMDIMENKITNNEYYGILIDSTVNNTISRNQITNNWVGIALGYSSNNNIISENHIAENLEGLDIYYSKNCLIKQNNFINNDEGDGFFQCRAFRDLPRCKWVENYWDEWPYIRPKPVKGALSIFIIVQVPFIYNTFSWYNFDWHPAQKPYNIQGMS
jgi:parallel beta-helix repeat protein